MDGKEIGLVSAITTYIVAIVIVFFGLRRKKVKSKTILINLSLILLAGIIGVGFFIYNYF